MGRLRRLPGQARSGRRRAATGTGQARHAWPSRWSRASCAARPWTRRDATPRCWARPPSSRFTPISRRSRGARRRRPHTSRAGDASSSGRAAVRARGRPHAGRARAPARGPQTRRGGQAHSGRAHRHDGSDAAPGGLGGARGQEARLLPSARRAAGRRPSSTSRRARGSTHGRLAARSCAPRACRWLLSRLRGCVGGGVRGFRSSVFGLRFSAFGFRFSVLGCRLSMRCAGAATGESRC